MYAVYVYATGEALNRIIKSEEKILRVALLMQCNQCKYFLYLSQNLSYNTLNILTCTNNIVFSSYYKLHKTFRRKFVLNFYELIKR